MKKKILTICVDVDDVLRDFMGKLLEVFLREHPEYTKKDIKPATSWDLSKSYPKSSEYLNEFIFQTHAEEIYTEAPTMKDALEGFKTLQKWCTLNGHRLICLTSQPRTEMQLYTIQWLMANGFESKEVCIVRGDKTIVNGDILLDDGLHNLEDWKKVGRTAVCLDQTWNQEWEGTRVANIGEFTTLIKNIGNGAVL